MTIAEWMILAAVLLYLLTLAPVKVLSQKRFDNSNPRDPTFYEFGMAARALGAHLNGIETFPFFAVSVLLAEFRQAPQHEIDLLAAAFILVRLAFVFAYLGNWPIARTLVWNLGFVINTAIFLIPWWAGLPK